MNIFNRKKTDEADEYVIETDDRLIVFDSDNRTSDINFVTKITSDSIIVDGLYVVPIKDCEVTTGRNGRNFFYRAPQESITETQRLAQLEKNMILSQITAYTPPVLPNSIDWVKGLLFGMLFIAMIIIAIVA